MSLVIWLIVIAIAAILSGLFSGLETGIYAYDSVEKKRETLKTHRLLKRQDSLVIACLVGTNFSVYLATFAFGESLNELGIKQEYLHFLEIILLTPVLFLVGEVVPKGLFQSKSNLLLPKFTWFLTFFSIIFGPIIVLLKGMTQMVTHFFAGHGEKIMVLSRERLYWILQDHISLIGHEQKKMVENALEMKERRVTSLMDPCKKVARVPVNLDISEVKKRFLESDYSFLVVYEGKPENILGIVYLNKILLTGNNSTLKECLIEIPEITYKTTLTGALETMRAHSKPIAKVIGARGHVLGIVFTRRIVQEIVGELQIW